MVQRIFGAAEVSAHELFLRVHFARPQCRCTGTGEAIPVPDSSARALIAAQSFHWMSSATTLREVHRVLVPGSLFVIVWNTRDYTVPWVR